MKLTPESCRELRQSFNLSQYALAQAVGLARCTIANFEQGEVKMRPACRDKILKFFRERTLDLPERPERFNRPDHLPRAVWMDLEQVEDSVRIIRSMLEEAKIPQDFWMVRNHLASMAHNLASLTWRISEHQLKDEAPCKP